MAKSLVVYFSIPKPPESDAGGPIAVAKLLIEKILANGGKLRILIGENVTDVPVKLIVGAKLVALDTVVQESRRSIDQVQHVGQSILKSSTLEQRLSTGLGTLLYLLALRSWDIYKRFRLGLALRHDLREFDEVIVLAFGLPTLNDFTKLKKLAANLTLLYYEQSKGGFARENRLFLPDSLPGKSAYVGYLRRADETIYAEADRCLFPSEGAKKLCEEEFRLDTKRVRIVYNGIPDYLGVDEVALRQLIFARQGGDTRTIVNIALHVPEKQVSLFLSGAAKFMDHARSSGNITKYEAVNYGKYTHLTESYRQQLVSSSQIPLPIHLKGGMAHAELINTLRSAWVYVTVPNVVVFDLALLEAMCMGLPVVASPFGGNVEALGEDYPLFAKTSDDIVSCLDRLAQSAEFYTQISLRNRERFQALFTLEQQISSISKVIAEFAN